MSGTEGVTVNIQTITPKVAAAWLTANKVNRPLRKNRVATYAEQMRRGQWQLTGEPIQRNGAALLNGQHRLSACIEADTPFTTVVVSGVQDDAMRVMDSGMPRSVADALRFSGQANTFAAAATARVVLAWEGGSLRDTHRQAREITRDDLIDFCLDNDEAVQRAVNQGRHVAQAVGMQAAVWAAFYFAIERADAEAAQVFTDMLVNGDRLEQGDPIFALRSWAISSALGKRQRRKHEVLAVATKAWNAWLAGEKIKTLKFLPTEAMPTISAP